MPNLILPHRRPLIVPARPRLWIPARPRFELMNLTRGARLLGTGGKRRLRPGGRRQLINAAGVTCGGCGCACSSGKKCFQEWIAAWSCADQAWSGPVTDNRVCLDEGTDTGWVKIAGDASGCTYRKRVPYEPAHCCTANGDCGVGLSNTATPALPFGGGVPNDCCVPCNCNAGCRNVGPVANVNFSGWISIGCLECPNGDGTSIYKYLTGTLGTYPLDQIPDPESAGRCVFVGDFSDISFTQSHGDSGQECPTGDIDIGPSVGNHITLIGGTEPITGNCYWSLHVQGEGTILSLFDGLVYEGVGATGPLVIDNDYVEGDNCGADNPYGFGGSATVTFPPCVPA